MKLPVGEIAEMTGAVAPPGKDLHDAVAQGYSIDSRTIGEGDVFFAIQGEMRDGHEFIDAAFQRGALAAMASRGPGKHRERLLLVSDPRAALRQLAARARQRWGGRVVAITGSNGKTTTKEITAALLSTRFRVSKSGGNLNNDLGVPLSLLRMDDNAEVGVLEFGMNHAGEIRGLAAIACPDVGVVTNVNAAHLEFFHSLDGIAQAKRELIESLPGDGVAVLNADDERVREFARAFSSRVVRYGVDAQADIRAVEIEERGLEGTKFQLEGSGVEFCTPLPGRHNLYNTLAGIGASSAMGISPDSLVQAVARLEPARMRGETLELGEIRIINDCYNANPRAVEAMLDLLAATPARRRVAVLGEMLELGSESQQLHRQVGSKAVQAGINLLVGVQGAAKQIVERAVEVGMPENAARFFADAPGAGEFLREALRPGDVVLFKASRGVKLEQALEAVSRQLSMTTKEPAGKGVDA